MSILLFGLSVLFIAICVIWITQTRYWLFFGIIFVLLSILFAWLGAMFYKKRAKRRYQKQKINEVQYEKMICRPKRFVIFVIVISVVLLCVQIYRMTQGGKFFPGCYLAYSVNDDNETCTIDHSELIWVKKLDIPSTINGYRVTTIGDNAFSGMNIFQDRSRITNINIPDSITTIGNQAFENCYGLTSITIPNSVISIGEEAFSRCTGLTSITIPNSVISIGNKAFFGSSKNLTSIVVAEDNPVYYSIDNCLIETESKTLLLGCNSSIIPNDRSIAHIEEGAFYYCDSLTILAIPDGVISIGKYAFSFCENLTSVIIPDSVTQIDYDVFSGSCNNLINLEVEWGNPTYYSKDNCLIEFESSTLLLGCASSVIPDSVKVIGTHAFDRCNGLSTITIPNSVTYICNEAFFECDNLTDITIPPSVAKIEEDAFSGCQGIIERENNISYVDKWVIDTSISKSAILREDTVGICDRAFSFCNELTHITIPNSVRYIGYGAFLKCNNLTSIKMSSGLVHIDEDAFDYCNSLEDVYVTDIEAWLNVSFGNLEAYPNQYAQLHFWDVNGNEVSELIIPNTVTSINDYAFYNSFSLRKVTIGNSVKNIGTSAFANCISLIDVTMGDNITCIGTSAFNNCTSLMSITIPYNVNEIKNFAFENCTALKEMNFKNPNNWFVEIRQKEQNWWGTKTLKATAEEMGDPSVAARYLCSDIYNGYWYRK